MSKFLNPNIKTIFIMLGSACNLQCKYCMQHEIVCDPIAKEINPDVINFIVDKAKSQDSEIDVRFYGGEPLIYFDNIKAIVKELEERLDGKIKFSIITNGKLIDEDKVAFFNAHFYSVAVSWDGRNVMSTRGYDVVKEKKELLLEIEHLCISGVISSFNYTKEFIEDVSIINKEYMAIHKYGLQFATDEIMDIGLGDNSLLDIDYGRLQTEVEDFCNSAYNALQGNDELDDYENIYLWKAIGRSLDSDINRSMMACGNGYYVLNLDLQGNLYKCHNTHIKLGTIYDDFWVYIHNVIKNDCTRELDKECSVCPVQSICHNGCVLVNKEARKGSYCKMKKAVFTPILKFINKYKEGVL